MSQRAKRIRAYLCHPRHLWWAITNRLHGYKFGPVQRFRCCDHTTPFHYQDCQDEATRETP